jgi:7-cyano-7-deazaguanine tRNA-ribosyltransferase
MNFEITDKDVMGRTGRLKTPNGIIDTPALMPVINPNLNFIDVGEMKKIGAQAVITNSYIIYRNRNLREIAVEKGVHGLIKSDIPVMTDSGSYQLMVYGDVEIDNQTIVEFQNRIKSDIVVPLDIPTPPYSERERAERELRVTLEREREAIELHSEIGDDRLISAPIQGSTFMDLRRKSAEEVSKLNASFFPIGGVVPLLDSYRFQDVVRIILEVKSVLPPSAPVHLFGAGHPMIFSIAAALGCDFFDSAAYALYAKDDRYLTVYGTKKLEELHYFPCNCPVCSNYTPDELRKMPKKERELELARHNLHASFEELNTVKQAIKEKSLFELVESRIRGHPYLVSAWRIIKEYEETLELYDPSSKQGFFYTGIETLYRPSIKRHHERMLNLELEKDSYLISTKENSDFKLIPAFGVVAGEFYPAGHAEMPEDEYVEDEAILEGLKGLLKFLKQYSNKSFKVELSRRWFKILSLHRIELPDNAEVILKD